jgi:hypothetical protein
VAVANSLHSEAPIGTLVSNRCRELSVSKAELVRQAGYRNVAKGLRRLHELCSGDLSKSAVLIHGLPGALALAPDLVSAAVEETRRQVEQARHRAWAGEDERWRAAFKPHAIILTERSRPEPFFVAALIGVDRILRVDFDLTAGRASFVHQALNGIRLRLAAFKSGSGALPAYGRPTGVIVNYTPDRAVRFDLEGNALEILPRAYRAGDVQLWIGKSRLQLQAAQDPS